MNLALKSHKNFWKIFYDPVSDIQDYKSPSRFITLLGEGMHEDKMKEINISITIYKSPISTKISEKATIRYISKISMGSLVDVE